MAEATKRLAPPVALKAIQLEEEVVIEAPASRVFEALTTDIAAWWGFPYLFSDAAKNIVLEARLGGRFYEDWGDGDGWLWAIVTGIKKLERIELTGTLAMTGAVQGTATIRLKARGKETSVKVTHRAVGEIDEETRKEYSRGWQDLLGNRLKAFVEAGKRQGIAAKKA